MAQNYYKIEKSCHSQRRLLETPKATVSVSNTLFFKWCLAFITSEKQNFESLRFNTVVKQSEGRIFPHKLQTTISTKSPE